ncbi:MAG: AEC family transporter [Rhodospirillaceae bacterium]|nr:AEC family transporter [Rhodospirillaceae bacterium]
MLYDLFAIIAPVFACAGIGYFWARTDQPFHAETVTSLVTNVATPFMVFDTLVRMDLTLETFGRMGVATMLVLAGFGLLGTAFLLVCRLPLRSFLPAMMFTNSGNIGLPICLFAFGEPGLALAISFFGILVMFQFTVGIAISAGSASPKFLFRSPIVYALAAALIFMGLGLEMPKWMANTVHLIGQFAIPLMLIALGVSLAKLRVTMLTESLAVALARLFIGFGVGAGVAMILDLQPLEAGVLILQSAMPVAVFNYLFALRYNRSPEAVAGAVVLSSLIGFATLPALLWMVLSRI